MKFICHKETLLKELLIAQDIISSKNSLSILSNLYLKAAGNSLTIKATDTKIGFETVIPISAEEEGEVIVFCEKFVSIVRTLPDDEILIEKNNSLYNISTLNKNISFSLKPTTEENFPELPEIEDDNYFEIAQNIFSEMVNQTIFSVSDDETRHFMNGVFLERNADNISMVATDGRRLSFIAKNIEDIPHFDPIIIPPKTLRLIQKICGTEGTFKLAIQDKKIFIKVNSQKIFSNIIDGQFPNYKRVIPEEQDSQAIIKRTELLDALKRVSILVDKRARRIFLDFTDNLLTIKSDQGDYGEAKEIISCDYSGEDTTIALNYTYLEDPLRIINEDNIILKFSGPHKAISLHAEKQDDYFHIIMPMQIE